VRETAGPPSTPLPGSRAVTFDLWHTLVYLEPEAEERYMTAQQELAARALLASADTQRRSDVTEAMTRAAFAEEYKRAVSSAEAGRSVPPSAQIVRSAQRLGLDVDVGAYLAELGDLVRRNPFRPAPGAVDVLRTLREAGYRTAIISNTVGEPGATLRPMLSELGIDRWVETFVFSDEQPWTKPSAEIFHHALAEIASEPACAVHVGDGWSDIEGARRARLRGGILFTGLQRYGERYRQLFLPNGWDAPKTPFRTDRLETVPDLVRQLLPPDGPRVR
jgi:FMN phosphatase YigB (HAD superfamily)